jgi:hypothetical protein
MQTLLLINNKVKIINIVKRGFGKVFWIFIFLQEIDKSYRQVLTWITNSSLLLKLQNLDKSRLATFYTHIIQRKTVTLTGLILIGETVISMILNHRVSTLRRSPLKCACEFSLLVTVSFSVCHNLWYSIDITLS